VREMEEGAIKQIVEEVLASPDKYPAEARFLLQLQTWYRQGASYVDVSRFEVVEGEIKEMLLEVKNEGYPHRIIQTWLIIPLTLPTVIYQSLYSDFEPRKDIVHIFTIKGWIKIKVNGNE
jgi:hypothetical protein